MTLVIFSTMVPTSCRSWSMVMGRPIMEVRQVCSVTRLVATSWCGSAVAPSEWVVPIRLLPWIAWEAAGPLHQLEHDPVPDAAQLVRQLAGRVVQQVRYVSQGGNIFKVITVN